MILINDFKDYEILDMANGQKLERWGQYILSRPDPQIIWHQGFSDLWSKAHAQYTRSNTGGGSWQINSHMPSSWTITYDDLKFNLKLMGFKHTGLFPEQAYNWNLIKNIIKNSHRPVKVLNLFAYTGAASVVALKAGASVVHVDSSRGMVDWAKENVKLNDLSDKHIRFIVDDVRKFVSREIRRQNKYDIIIMDPPTFGRGNKNEVWSIENDLDALVSECVKLLSTNPLLFIINSYTTGVNKVIIENLLNIHLTSKLGGQVMSDELCLPLKNSQIYLPCGLTANWQNNK